VTLGSADRRSIRTTGLPGSRVSPQESHLR